VYSIVEIGGNPEQDLRCFGFNKGKAGFVVIEGMSGLAEIRHSSASAIPMRRRLRRRTIILESSGIGASGHLPSNKQWNYGYLWHREPDVDYLQDCVSEAGTLQVLPSLR
jgi:hypothetical protein